MITSGPRPKRPARAVAEECVGNHTQVLNHFDIDVDRPAAAGRIVMLAGEWVEERKPCQYTAASRCRDRFRTFGSKAILPTTS